jgi:hypothetical protein
MMQNVLALGAAALLVGFGLEGPVVRLAVWVGVTVMLWRYFGLTRADFPLGCMPRVARLHRLALASLAAVVVVFW